MMDQNDLFALEEMEFSSQGMNGTNVITVEVGRMDRIDEDTYPFFGFRLRVEGMPFQEVRYSNTLNQLGVHVYEPNARLMGQALIFAGQEILKSVERTELVRYLDTICPPEPEETIDLQEPIEFTDSFDINRADEQRERWEEWMKKPEQIEEVGN